ncbi:hypothetical protein A3860_15065 [Niastella vici]|uniref:Uncharacterized protein n=1 Tax=Niastella vici TaxID=1703345 RepID=A0A1V9G5I8_9BACT|nr:hypothetical protein A3860_15065 [Niastella vici]
MTGFWQMPQQCRTNAHTFSCAERGGMGKFVLINEEGQSRFSHEINKKSYPVGHRQLSVSRIGLMVKKPEGEMMLVRKYLQLF